VVQSGFGDFSATEVEKPAAERVQPDPVQPEPQPEPRSQPAATVAPEPPAAEPAAEPAVSQSATGTAVMDEPAPAAAKRRRKSKEEMLARALVSDIMVYNRDLYDKAKAEGNLLEALGPEIKKSWELYKEKVTPEVANSTNHFRDALNEILADGENIF
jgi:hypothetical protein